MKSIISLLLMGNRLSAQTNHPIYDFVTDNTCEYYGMQRIEDPAICQHAASQLVGTDSIQEAYTFYDRDTWTNTGRPNGCSYHKFGNIEQWHHEHEETCDVNGFAGCLCVVPPKYGFVSDESCEFYGMERIEDPSVCQEAASQLVGTHGIEKGYTFYDRDTWTNSGRPNGCSYHKFGNIEQWHHNHEETCDVNGFAGCLCIVPRFSFVADKSCEHYGMERIEDPEVCQEAASQIKGTNGVEEGYNFYDRDTWTNTGRPNGCSYHKFGNVEQWHHEYEEDCDVNGFAGCICKVTSPSADNGIKAPMRATPRWIDVSFSDVHPFQTNADVTLSQDSDGELVVDGELQVRGCGSGSSSSFGIIVDDFYYPKERWTKIRYTIEFVSGASSCYSLFGDTHYGDFADGADFGLTTLSVIDNELTVGSFGGEKKLCNNEKSNFLHLINGVGNKGFLRVEQSRDTSVQRAGISSGFSCTSVGQIVRYKDIQVMYWR